MILQKRLAYFERGVFKTAKGITDRDKVYLWRVLFDDTEFGGNGFCG